MSRATATALVVLGLAQAGCGSWRPPRRVAPRHAGPIRSRDVGRGEDIFLSLCVACHRGRVNPAGYHWSPGQMRHQIREGNRMMPPISSHRLTDDDVEAVLAYLSTVGAIDGALPAGPDDWLGDAWFEQPVDGVTSTSETADAPPASAPGSGRALAAP